MTSVTFSNKSQDTYQDKQNNMDYDDLTNSSIIEFLNRERECLNGDESTEIDVESIFEEINRLSDNNDDRSVEELLKEAEILLSKQEIIGCSVLSNPPSLIEFHQVAESLGNQNLRSNKVKSKERSYNESEENAKATQAHVQDVECDKAMNNLVEKLETVVIEDSGNNPEATFIANAKSEQNETENVETYSIKSRTQSPQSGDNSGYERTYDKSSAFSSTSQVPSIMDNTFTRPNSVLSNSTLNEKSFCNKSTNSSPVHSGISDNFSIKREHILKNEIEILQEKLKDTEERLQSLQIQHHSLSQIHRTLRESHSNLQEESELLKLDVQHLTECANILRSELQSARADRNEALEVQKVLQSELEESRNEKKKAHDQTEKDAKVIQDLQRQCKEMERILMRKHPDSVSALIVASKSPLKNLEENSASRRLLEQRIAQLEADARDQDLKAQRILANVQARFNSVQSKYETHIADLETQVLSLQEINTKLNEKIEKQMTALNNYSNDRNKYVSNCTQTEDIQEKEAIVISKSSSSTQTDSRPNSSLKAPLKKTQTNKMPVSHSDTTISSYHAAAKEDAHLLATIRGMRVDLAIKEKAMQRLTRELEECKKTIKKLQKEKDAIKSEKAPSSSNSRKLFEINQNFEQISNQHQALKEALNKIKLLEFDYKALHDKRLQDLKTLQAAHERELSSCHETVRILQQRLAERDEAFALQKRRKVPIDYYALKAKVSSLERRHSEREQRLHMLVEALSKGRFNEAIDEILTENGQ